MSTSTGYLSISGVAITPHTDGGAVAVPPSGRVISAGPVFQTQSGVAFGPLEIEPGSESTVGISRLEYPANEDTGLLAGLLSVTPAAWLASTLAAGPLITAQGEEAARESDSGSPLMSRRDVLKLGAVASGGLAATSPAAANGGDRIRVAEIDIDENPAGLTLGLTDTVSGVLPADNSYSLSVDGITFGSFAPSESASVPSGTTGTIRIEVKSPGLGAYLSNLLGPPEHSLEFTIENTASSHDVGDVITLTDDTATVDAVATAGPSETIVEIGGTSIPHPDEDDDSDVGTWKIQDDSIKYTVGDSAPAAYRGVIRAHVSRSAELLDDASRF